MRDRHPLLSYSTPWHPRRHRRFRWLFLAEQPAALSGRYNQDRRRVRGQIGTPKATSCFRDCWISAAWRRGYRRRCRDSGATLPTRQRLRFRTGIPVRRRDGRGIVRGLCVHPRGQAGAVWPRSPLRTARSGTMVNPRHQEIRRRAGDAVRQSGRPALRGGSSLRDDDPAPRGKAPVAEPRDILGAHHPAQPPGHQRMVGPGDAKEAGRGRARA